MSNTDVTDLLRDARDAFARRDWPHAREAFTVAHQHGTLAADDMLAFGDSIWWLGSFRQAETRYEEAYHLYLKEERPQQAAMSAMAITGLLFMRGEAAAGSGWSSRAFRLLNQVPESAAHGYALFMELEETLGSGDYAATIDTALRMQDFGRRFDDPSLTALGLAGQGRALIRQGHPSEGIALLDEAMLAVVADELDPAWAGNIYCQMMRVCYELSDLQRAGEWTQATARWCESMPASGPFLGVCRVHRAQVLQTHGHWEQAEREATRACEDLAGFDLGTVAEGHYQMGEIRRLRGDLAGAEQAFREAHGLGRDPQPGLALLWLAQGRVDAALSSIRAALAAESGNPLARARLCAAQVEIALQAGDLESARSASEELEETAHLYRSSGLEAAAPQAQGAVLLADGRPDEALPALRLACLRWQQLNAPYEAARVRLLLAQVYDALDNEDAASLELDAAEAVFTRLGALPDDKHVARLRKHPSLPNGLTRREAEVLALVATGKTNREIGAVLAISEKTVARHLSNVFTKLDLTSRTAAAAFAFKHGIASRRPG